MLHAIFWQNALVHLGIGYIPVFFSLGKEMLEWTANSLPFGQQFNRVYSKLTDAGLWSKRLWNLEDSYRDETNSFCYSSETWMLWVCYWFCRSKLSTSSIIIIQVLHYVLYFRVCLTENTNRILWSIEKVSNLTYIQAFQMQETSIGRVHPVMLPKTSTGFPPDLELGYYAI